MVPQFLIGLIALFTGVAIAAQASRVDELIPILIFGLPGLWLVIRCPVAGVYCTSEGVVYRGIMKTVRTGWADVVGVETATTSSPAATAYFPRLRLSSGGEVDLMSVAGYGMKNTRVEEVIEWLRASKAEFDRTSR
ncbi:hypothetical protein [Kitasatospora sp. NPDC093806]|uniref:hypothetical protein n=1 Tax=Kitasatospora sp. NPDC093806 TaxID=3155075 RepID=UPI00341A576E